MGERAFIYTGSCGLDELERLLVCSLSLAPKTMRSVFKAKRLLLAALALPAECPPRLWSLREKQRYATTVRTEGTPHNFGDLRKMPSLGRGKNMSRLTEASMTVGH